MSALPSVTTPYQVTPFKPESVRTFELGYKGLAWEDKLLIDIYGYYGQYQDFLSRTLLVQPKATYTLASMVSAIASNINVSNVANIYSIPVNAPSKVKTYGFGLSLDYRLPAGFIINSNVSSDNLKDVPAGFNAYFNSPKYRANLGFGNSGFGNKKRFGFNVSYRWQDAFYYEAEFANDNLPAIHTVDAQFSIKLPSTKSIIKLGANNLLNQYYVNAAANSIVGGLYYVSFGYNVF